MHERQGYNNTLSFLDKSYEERIEVKIFPKLIVFQHMYISLYFFFLKNKKFHRLLPKKI